MEKKTIYAVIRYPKQINRFSVKAFDFIVYTKQTSNLDKMKAYLKEIKGKYPEGYYIYLVSREKAKELHQKWIDRYCKDEPQISMEELDRRLNNIYAKNAFYD